MAVTNLTQFLVTTAQALGLTPDNFLLLLQQCEYNQVTGITANYTVASGINYVANGTLAGNTVITLPLAASVPAQKITIKATGSLNGHTLGVAASGSDTIDGSGTFSLSAQYKYVVVISDGTTWNILGSN